MKISVFLKILFGGAARSVWVETLQPKSLKMKTWYVFFPKFLSKYSKKMARYTTVSINFTYIMNSIDVTHTAYNEWRCKMIKFSNFVA